MGVQSRKGVIGKERMITVRFENLSLLVFIMV